LQQITMELQRLDVCPPLVIIEFAALEGRDVSWIGYPALDLRIDQTGELRQKLPSAVADKARELRMVICEE
jgi:hypothetical protein